MRINKRKDQKLQSILQEISKTMENYPNGVITDLIGANHIYDQINRAFRLGKQAGYPEEEIGEMIAKAKLPQTAAQTAIQTVATPASSGCA